MDPASERVLVTELLKRDDPRHALPEAIRARRKEIEDLHSFADWANTVTLDEWESSGSDGTWSRQMMLTSVKNSEKAATEQFLKRCLFNCWHRVYNSARQDVIGHQRALLREHGLTVRPVSGTEWRRAWVAEATASLRDEYELTILLADEKASVRQNASFGAQRATQSAHPQAGRRVGPRAASRKHCCTARAVPAGRTPQVEVLLVRRYRGRVPLRGAPQQGFHLCRR